MKLDISICTKKYLVWTIFYYFIKNWIFPPPGFSSAPFAAFTNVPSDFDKYHKSEASYHGNLIVEWLSIWSVQINPFAHSGNYSVRLFVVRWMSRWAGPCRWFVGSCVACHNEWVSRAQKLLSANEILNFPLRKNLWVSREITKFSS